MKAFFPAPYPDECLYSILCRYYVRTGSTGYAHTSTELFGNVQILTSSVYLPMRIECIDSWVSPSSGITRRSIAENNTLYPYWAISYPPDYRFETERIISGGSPVPEFDRVGALKSRRSWSKCLKYCPICAAEDISRYGEAYWHRRHQLAEMIYCVKHRIRLLDSDVLVRRAATRFYPLTSVLIEEHDKVPYDDLLPHMDKLLKIGQECEWLIEHGLEVGWAANGYDKYLKLLRDKGIATFQGRCDYYALESAFNDYWGTDFLDALFSVTGDSRINGWTDRIDRNKMRSYKPLNHILLMCFLADSVSGFISSNPADTPYGHPPFLCENPICPNYHIAGAELVNLRYYGNGVTASFECTYCGIQYKHNKAKYSRELRVVIDYGHLWDNVLRHCCADPTITNKQAAEILKCSMSVLMNQKRKRGLLEPALYDTEMGPEKYYKARVAELCAEYDEVTIALLQEKVPGAYSYLGDHHKDWLRSRIVFEKERKYLRENEERLLERVRAFIDRLTTKGYPKRQVTFGYIASIIGAKRDELRCRKVTSALLENVIESKEAWLRRRIIMAYRQRPASDAPFTLTDVKRALTIHDVTYAKHQKLIKQIITELNGNETTMEN